MPRMKSRVLGLATTVVLCATTASAEGDLLQTDELAEAIVAMTTPVWTGPRTPEPERRPRRDGRIRDVEHGFRRYLSRFETRTEPE